MTNLLYYGDNLEVLRASVPSDSVDLIYLDPPFNSKRAYNVLFKSQGGGESVAQIQAFDDTWRWSQQTEELFAQIVGGGVPSTVADAVSAMRNLLGTSDMMAYLVVMAPRLVELHRVLKGTGSLYLHCDPSASHYLKLLLDATFGAAFFRGEIIWQRSSAHNDTAQGQKQPGRIHDVLLFYTKGKEWKWNPMFVPYSEEYVAERFVNTDSRGAFKDADLSAAKPGGDTSYDWRVRRTPGGDWESDLDDEWKTPQVGWEYLGVPPPQGRYWAYSKQKMRAFAEDDRLYYFSTGTPRLKQYASEMEGVSLQDLWLDIPPINARAAERLGYPTQKPLALLERIISVSSDEGDVVLDPFCGCGTTIDAAQHLKRRWVGIDVTYLAIDLIRKRLRHSYGGDAEYTVKGIPTDVEGAAALFAENPFDFERWAVSLIDAQPNEKQVGDKGIDGRVRFHDDKRIGQVLVSVKGGATINPSMLRDLEGTVQHEKAEMGILITMAKPTRGIVDQAKKSGSYKSALTGQSYPKVQVLTIAELIAGKRPDMPTAIMPYIKASQARGAQLKLI